MLISTPLQAKLVKFMVTRSYLKLTFIDMRLLSYFLHFCLSHSAHILVLIVNKCLMLSSSIICRYQRRLFVPELIVAHELQQAVGEPAAFLTPEPTVENQLRAEVLPDSPSL